MSGILKFWLFECPFLFFFSLSGFSNMIWSWRRLNFCQSLPGPQKNFWRCLFQWSEFRVTCPRIWQTSVFIDVPIIINSFFLCNVQICMSWPCDINIFQWNGECFFFRQIELKSRFVVMMADEITLSRPEAGTGFSVISCLPVETLPIRLEILLWDFHSSRCAPVLEWVPGIRGLFLNFAEPSATRNTNSPLHWVTRIYLWCVQIFQFFNTNSRNVSFPNSPRDQSISYKDSW